MKATNPTYQDGVWYQPGEEIWDLGSWKADPQKSNGMFKSYNGLSADVAKLPHYVDTGSTAYCMDTTEVYMYEERTDKWYKQ